MYTLHGFVCSFEKFIKLNTCDHFLDLFWNGSAPSWACFWQKYSFLSLYQQTTWSVQKGSNEHETSEAAMVLVNTRLHHDRSQACKVPCTCLSLNYYLNLEEIIIQLKFFVFWARLRGSEGAWGGGLIYGQVKLVQFWMKFIA